MKKFLPPYLPLPVVERDERGRYYLDHERPDSIGRVRSFYGNFGVLVKAYAYLRSMGSGGLRSVSENAVLNANYMKERLREAYELPYDRPCMHEFVLSGSRQKKEKGVSTMEIAKRLLDYGHYAPTVYFPLIVKEALMIEPTETENRESLEEFTASMLRIAREIEENPDLVRGAPHTTAVRRLDEARAARRPDLRWRSGEEHEREEV